MKKFLAACLAAVAVSVSAGDRDVAFYVGHKNGGLGATFQTVLSEELIKRGWNVDFKIIGNCGQVKNLMETSDKPILTGWSGDWNASEKNVCFLPPTKDNFVATFIVTPRLLCGPTGDNNFILEKGRNYRIGVNQGQNHAVLLEALGKKLGVTFKVVEYQNSGHIKRAVQAQEIDAWYTTAGLREHINKTQRCLYGTLHEPVSGIVPLNTLIDTKNAFSSFVGFYMTNEKFDKTVRNNLVNEINEIINSPAYQEKIKSAGSLVYTGDLDQQITKVKENSQSFR